MPPDPMPKVALTASTMTPEQRRAFSAARRGRNLLLLAALGGFCILIYVIALVKLHEYGQMW